MGMGQSDSTVVASLYSSCFDLTVGMFVVFFCFPFLVALISFLFGAVLAWAESWGVMQGFYYIVGNLCGLATPLTDNEWGKARGRFGRAFLPLPLRRCHHHGRLLFNVGHAHE